MSGFWETYKVFIKNYKTRNDLFLCQTPSRYHQEGCDRYFRRYQWQLHLLPNSSLRGKCPHCLEEKYIQEASYSWQMDQMVGAKEMGQKYPKWLDDEKDCPYIGLRGYWVIVHNILLKEDLKNQEAMMQRFEEYKARENSDWVQKVRERQKN